MPGDGFLAVAYKASEVSLEATSGISICGNGVGEFSRLETARLSEKGDVGFRSSEWILITFVLAQALLQRL